MSNRNRLFGKPNEQGEEMIPRAHFEVFAARVATIIGEQAARITNLEVSMAMRASTLQDKSAMSWQGRFSPHAYDQVRDDVRDRILAALLPSESE